MEKKDKIKSDSSASLPSLENQKVNDKKESEESQKKIQEQQSQQ